MSGVYIKGMEMPKSCEKCLGFMRCYTRGLFDPIGWCHVTGTELLNPNPPTDGPLVPVPPHGDLIDRDALMKGEGRYMISFGKEGIDVAEIDRAPTIIPAEEGE